MFLSCLVNNWDIIYFQFHGGKVIVQIEYRSLLKCKQRNRAQFKLISYRVQTYSPVDQTHVVSNSTNPNLKLKVKKEIRTQPIANLTEEAVADM